MEKVFKFIFGHRKRIMRIIAIILIFIVVIIFAASQYLITIDDGSYNEKNPGNTPYVVSKHINESALNGVSEGETKGKDIKTKTSADGGYALDIDLDELTDEIIEELRKEGGRLDVYFSGGNLHEYLKKMIKAEFITQYPDLRSASRIGTEVSEDEFQGVIKFIRHRSDGSERILEYIPLGEQDGVNGYTLYGLINQANGMGGVSESVIAEARSKVSNYFSIDLQGNLIVANWNETITKLTSGDYVTGYVPDEEEADYSENDRQNLNNATEEIQYEYFTHIINYKSSISKYTMPFNYLWAFLVCGRDEEFINDFTDFVLESQIEISIYDNLTEIEQTMIDAYNDNEWKSTRVSKRTLVDDSLDGEEDIGKWSEPEVINTTHNYQINYIKTYTNTIVVTVTDLDIWYMKYTANYTYEVEDSGEQKEIERLPEKDLNEATVEEGEWITVNTTKTPTNPNIPTGSFVMSGGVELNYTVTEDQEKTDITLQNKSNQCTFTEFYRTIQYKYTLEGDPEVTEKIDPKLKEGDEGYPNFCTLYLNSNNAMRNITGVESRVDSWLFEILQNNIDTVNMVELTKYMLYCATGNDYGVKEFNFDILYPTNMITGLYGGTVEEQIWFALLDAGYSKESAAGVLGNLQQESGMRTNNLQNSYEKSLGMDDEKYTQAVNSGIYTRFSVDSAGYGLAQWTSEGRKRGLYLYAQTLGADINDESMQIEYLLGEISPNGGANGLAHFQMAKDIGGYSYGSWVKASTPEEAAVAFCKVFERAGDEQLSNRRKYAREFYDRLINVTKGDISIGNIELTGENKAKMINMLNEAVRIANDDRYGYSKAKRTEEFYYDCSSLVYRLYEEYFEISVPNTTEVYPNYSSYNMGSPTEVTLQPGDILWRRKGSEGHVTIYIGNGNYVAAHTDKYPQASQISVYQDNPSSYTNVYRFIGR